MSGLPDWPAWALAAGIAALLAFFFWHTSLSLFRMARRLIGTIQDWPEIRRAMAEAEAQAGGRYPLWLRIARPVAVIAMICLGALLIWRKLAAL